MVKRWPPTTYGVGGHHRAGTATGSGTGGTGVVVPVAEVGDADVRARVRRLDHVAATDVDADVVDRVAEVHKVTRLQLRARDVRGRVILAGRVVTDRDAGRLPGAHSQAGAVERVRARAAVAVRLAELRVRVANRRCRATIST